VPTGSRGASAGSGELQEPGTKGGRARCLYRGHGTLPGVGLGHSISLRCKVPVGQGDGLETKRALPEGMSSGGGFGLTNSYSWQK